MGQKIVVAGATGHLGSLVVKALAKYNAEVVALVRPGTDESRLSPLRVENVTVTEVSLAEAKDLQQALRGAACVISTLQGLQNVIRDDQTALLDAAVSAGVSRFIPSDFALDFTKLVPGTNRNLDLRRDFHGVLRSRPIQATSILNGAFSTILTTPGVMVNFNDKQMNYWQNPDQEMDFTTLENVAQFTAAAALDASAPRVLRIAGGVASAREIAQILGEVTGDGFSLNRLGSLDDLAGYTAKVRESAPEDGKVFPQWSGMQYLHNMFGGEGKLVPLDNDRYAGIDWTGVKAILAAR